MRSPLSFGLKGQLVGLLGSLALAASVSSAACSGSDGSVGQAATQGGDDDNGGILAGGKDASPSNTTPDAPATSTPDAKADAGSEVATSEAGADAKPEGPSSICTEGEVATPYDHSRGLLGEFAGEVWMSCSLGGYMEPLVAADPGLSKVDEFTAVATDWFRARILACKGDTTDAAAGAFLLLPPSQAGAVSRGDFDATVKLFMSILDRHDDQPDAMTKKQKDEVKSRLNALAAGIVKSDSTGLTKPASDATMCVPAPTGDEAH